MGTAVKTFAASVSLLANAIGTTPKSQYERLRSDTEQARRVMEAAKLGIDKNRSEHGC
jgi:hypothetical protein